MHDPNKEMSSQSEELLHSVQGLPRQERESLNSGSANSVGDLCPNSEDSDSISPDPASILSSATDNIIIAF